MQEWQELLLRLICPWHIHPCCLHITHNDSATDARKAIAAGEDKASLFILLIIEFLLESLHLNGHIRHKIRAEKLIQPKKKKKGQSHLVVTTSAGCSQWWPGINF